MVIHQAAFDGGGAFLKGGLHCHTTRSDGKGTPEETIQMHIEHGYDFLALTDHRFYNRKNFIPGSDIIIVPGMEFDNTIESQNGFRCFHTVCIGADDASNTYSQGERFESGKAKNQEEYQPYLDRIHAAGNMTVYCHPEWSSTPARYFENMKGNFAMEIWNSGCVIEDGMDANAAYWDELLGQGKKIFGVATDDGHQMYQHCNGWVMVNAEKNIPSILSALSEGRFYSSCGPVIKDFYIENGEAVLISEPVKSITFHCERHPNDMEERTDCSLTRHTCKLNNNYTYVRASVMDGEGRRAWTNPIYIK